MIRHRHIHSQRRGFTMIELLVVIGLIAFLMTLSIGVLRNAIGSARERATEATITKINGLVQQRVDGFNRAMERSDLEPGVQQMLAKMFPRYRGNKAMRRANEVMVKGIRCGLLGTNASRNTDTKRKVPRCFTGC